MKTTMLRHERPFTRRSGGFTLVELLVGMLIAMIGVIIMMQVLLNSEERNRTTTGGNEAMSNGAVMLHLLQRDLLQAGYGLNAMSLLGCTLTVPTGATLPLAPVVINPATSLVPAGDANTDTLLIVYGNDDGQPEGNPIYTVDVATNKYAVQAPTSFSVGDFVVGSPDACSGALTLTQVTAVDATNVTVGAANAAATVLFNLGPQPRVVAYAVRNGSLVSCDFRTNDCRTNNATNWVSVSGNIPSLRAVYGRDTAAAGSMDGVVDAYNQTAPASACDWARIGAVRVAVVARSITKETTFDTTTGLRVDEAVTTAAPVWFASTRPNALYPTADASVTAVDVQLSESDWQAYRYRTFETSAPLRNVIWMGVQSGC